MITYDESIAWARKLVYVFGLVTQITSIFWYDLSFGKREKETRTIVITYSFFFNYISINNLKIKKKKIRIIFFSIIKFLCSNCFLFKCLIMTILVYNISDIIKSIKIIFLNLFNL